jgi:hypothetical protein
LDVVMGTRGNGNENKCDCYHFYNAEQRQRHAVAVRRQFTGPQPLAFDDATRAETHAAAHTRARTQEDVPAAPPIGEVIAQGAGFLIWVRTHAHTPTRARTLAQAPGLGAHAGRQLLAVGTAVGDHRHGRQSTTVCPSHGVLTRVASHGLFTGQSRCAVVLHVPADADGLSPYTS